METHDRSLRKDTKGKMIRKLEQPIPTLHGPMCQIRVSWCVSEDRIIYNPFPFRCGVFSMLWGSHISNLTVPKGRTTTTWSSNERSENFSQRHRYIIMMRLWVGRFKNAAPRGALCHCQRIITRHRTRDRHDIRSIAKPLWRANGPRQVKYLIKIYVSHFAQNAWICARSRTEMQLCQLLSKWNYASLWHLLDKLMSQRWGRCRVCPNIFGNFLSHFFSD